jgi:hypothetical protein
MRQVSLKDNERDTELDNLLETQHNTSFKENHGKLPYWRLIIFIDPNSRNKFVASFIYHHALGDGASGLIFHKHFQAALSSAPKPLASPIIHPSKSALLPNLEQLHSLPIPSPSTAPYLPKALWTGDKIASPMTSHFRSLTIPKETAGSFIRACRANGATVTSTIPVLIATALTKLIPNHFSDLECTIPVNIRHWLPAEIDEDAFGTWIDAFSQYYETENVKEFSWEEASRTRETIVEYLKSEGQRINVVKLQRIPDMREFFLSRVGKERGSSFDVSNLGVVVGEPGDWKMRKLVFSRSAFVSGSAVSVGVVTGADGDLVFGFCWQEGIITREVLEAIVGAVRTQVDRLAQGH